MLAHTGPHELRGYEAWAEPPPDSAAEDDVNPVVLLALALLLILAVGALLTLPFAWLERRRREELAVARRPKPRKKPFLKPSRTPKLNPTSRACPGCGKGKRRTQPWCPNCAAELASRARRPMLEDSWVNRCELPSARASAEGSGQVAGSR